jgi:hypothetical protein
MFTRSLLGVLLTISSVSAAGFSYPLFDGKTLDGWTIENDCQADVNKGTIRLLEGNGWLRSDHAYGDFLLHVEWKSEKDSKYDAGIYIRTQPGGSPFPSKGYQLNLLEGKEGACGSLKGATPPPGLIRKGRWNSFDIIVVEDSVSLAINGKPAYRASGITIQRGHIGLQVEVPGGGRFAIRNVQITELGYTSLFNGRDLTGWEGAGQAASTCWRVRKHKPSANYSKLWARAVARYKELGGNPAGLGELANRQDGDGTIECTGKKGPWLRTSRQFGDFNLRFQYQVSPGGNSGIYVRVPADGKHHRDNDKLPPAGFEVQVLDDSAKKYAKLKDYQYCGSVYAISGATSRVSKPAGQWNTMEINCIGQHITTTHNGVTIVRIDAKSHPKLALRKLDGFLGLQNHSTIVRFRRLRIGPAVAGH